MVNTILKSSALSSTLIALQRTQRAINSNQKTLATGLRVNSALDNPRNFFISRNLNSRAASLSSSLDTVIRSVQTLQKTNNGILALLSLLEQAKAQASSALEKAPTSNASTDNLATIRGDKDLRSSGELTQIISLNPPPPDYIPPPPDVDPPEAGFIVIQNSVSDRFNIDFVDRQTNTNQTLIVDINHGQTISDIAQTINNDIIGQHITASLTDEGQFQIQSQSENGVVRISKAEIRPLSSAGFEVLGLDAFISDEALNNISSLGGTVVGGRTISSKAAAETGKVNGSFVDSVTLEAAEFLIDSGELSFSISTDSVTSTSIEINRNTTISTLIEAINNDFALNDLINASFNTETGQIEVTADNSVKNVELRFEAISDNVNQSQANSGFGFGIGRADLNLFFGEAGSEFFTLGAEKAETVDLTSEEKNFNTVQNQIKALIADQASDNINLFAGDQLQTYFGNNPEKKLITQGIDLTAQGVSLEEANFNTSQTIQDTLDQINSITGELQQFSKSVKNNLSIVQTRIDFTQETINTLENSADDLVVADLNEASAELLALQAKQDIGVLALSLGLQTNGSIFSFLDIEV